MGYCDCAPSWRGGRLSWVDRGVISLRHGLGEVQARCMLAHHYYGDSAGGIISACAEKSFIFFVGLALHRNYLRMRGEEGR